MTKEQIIEKFKEIAENVGYEVIDCNIITESGLRKIIYKNKNKLERVLFLIRK